MPPMLVLILVILGAYLTGAIPFGYLVARWRGVDILKAGSGNIGATNVGRVLGKKFGILVFLVDCAKGALPVAIALHMKNQLPPDSWVTSGWLEVAAGLAAFLGHLFPVYLGFRGGKGVATGAGVMAVLMPGPALFALVVWVTVIAATSYVSLASLAAAVALAAGYVAMAAGVNAADPRALFCLFAVASVFIKHRANIARLSAGTENRIRWGHPMRKSLHVLTLGLWFGSVIFFTFVVTLNLLSNFQDLGREEDRPAWFPLPKVFAKTDAVVQGPKEQGSRAFGYAVTPLFRWYFPLQGVCAFIAAWTALAWARANPGVKIHRWRVTLLMAGLVAVLAGWPVERQVADLRAVRNQATDRYLAAPAPPAPALLESVQAARADFDHWHFVSLLLNFATVLLVTGGMAMAGELPELRASSGGAGNTP